MGETKERVTPGPTKRGLIKGGDRPMHRVEVVVEDRGPGGRVRRKGQGSRGSPTRDHPGEEPTRKTFDRT